MYTTEAHRSNDDIVTVARSRSNHSIVVSYHNIDQKHGERGHSVKMAHGCIITEYKTNTI